MSLTTRNLVAALIIALVIGGGFLLRTRVIAKREAAAPPITEPWALHSVKVRIGNITEGFPVLATLSTQDEISIKPQITGTIHIIGPRAGKVVSKGDVLVEIDTTEIKSNLAALKSSLASAQAKVTLQRAELTRTRKLIGKGFATPERRDQQIAALKEADGLANQLKAQISAAETRVSYGIIKSPVNGTIIVRNQTVGDLAAPGREIYRINAKSGAKVMVNVPQEVLANIKFGSPIILSYGGKTHKVYISRITPSLDALSMGTAESDLTSIPFDLPSGARVQARVITAHHKNVLLLPLSALAMSADGRHGVVFKILKNDKEIGNGSGEHLSKLRVEISANGVEGVAVTGNLKSGDRVITAHESQLLRLHDGDRVRSFPLKINLEGG